MEESANAAVERISTASLYVAVVFTFGFLSYCYTASLNVGSVFLVLTPVNQCRNGNETWELPDFPAASYNVTNQTFSAQMHDHSFGFTSSVVTQYQLCDKLALAELTNVLMFFGIIPGSLISGPISDNFGRKPTILAGLLTEIASNFIAVNVPWFFVHLIARFIMGFSAAFVIGTSFVLCSESLAPKQREMFALVFYAGAGMASITAAAVAYIVKQHIILFNILNGLGILTFILACCLYESPRWLIAENRSEVAFKNVQSILDSYNKCNSSSTLPEKDVMEEELKPMEPLNDQSLLKLNETTGQKSIFLSTLKALIFNKTLMLQTIVLCLHSAAVGFSFFGFFFVVSQVMPNIYSSVALMGLMEIPASIPKVHNFMARQRALFAGGILSAAACLQLCLAYSFFIDHDTQDTILVTIFLYVMAIGGKFCSSVSFIVVVLSSLELYETSIRNTGSGTVQAFLRFGSAISPMVNLIRTDSWRFAVLGLPILVTSIAVLIILPNTKHNLDVVKELDQNFVQSVCDGGETDLQNSCGNVAKSQDDYMLAS